MKNRIILTAMAIVALAGCCQQSGLDYVDTTIGGVGVLLQPTRPTVQVPNQMIRWSPRRTDLLDDMIADYPLTLTSHRQQSVFGFLPIAGVSEVNDVFHYHQVYDNEVNTPYEYKSELEGCSIRFAASKKSGVIAVSFEEAGDNALRMRTLTGQGVFSLDGDNAIVGTCNFAGIAAYMYMEADCKLVDPVEVGHGTHMIVKVDPAAKDVRLRYGISFISCEQAKANLDKEIPDFNVDKVAADAKAVWVDRMDQIEVSGGTDKHKTLFYTALYRCSERMVDYSEYGQYYSPFDHQVHESDKPFYNDNWMWDTHIALEPLQTILNPDMELDKINSYITMYEQCGIMPSFAVVWGEWAAMTGNYEAVWMADSWAKGLRFDLDTALKGLKKNSLEETLLPWRNGPQTSIDVFYGESGYYPAVATEAEEYLPEVSMPWERRQAVSITTAFSYADWAIAQLSKTAGNDEDVELFNKRAAFYRNVYRPEKQMFWPKDINGNWIDGTDPRYMDRLFYTENNAYTFQWDVKHDLYSLFDMMGGRAAAEKCLDDLFRIQISMSKFDFYKILPDATGMVGQFAMGNEPSFHIPYIYDYLGSPWKTQKRIHQLVDGLFYDCVMGLPGDEDGGGMSAFLVFSMMGFFPVTPGIPVYAMGSPFFEKTTINLPDGKKFTVKAKNFSEENKYIQGAKLNGKTLDRAWFTHKELMAGGVLELTMGSTPNKEWGADEATLPPSSIDFDLSSLE